MLRLAYARRLASAVLPLCCLFAGHCAAANGIGLASATVMPSPLSASVALYVRTVPGTACPVGCQAGDVASPAAVALDRDGAAQFSMSGVTTTNYIVQMNAAGYSSAWSGRSNGPIMLESVLAPGGGVSIVIGRAPSSVFADAFQVVINYN